MVSLAITNTVSHGDHESFENLIYYGYESCRDVSTQTYKHKLHGILWYDWNGIGIHIDTGAPGL